MGKTQWDFAGVERTAVEEGIDLPLSPSDATREVMAYLAARDTHVAKEAEKERGQRWAFRGKLLAAIVTVVSTLGVGYLKMKPEKPEPTPAITPTDVQASVRTESKALHDRVGKAEERIGNVETAVEAVGELQLQQGEETRSILLDVLPKSKRGKYKEKSDTLKRAEARMKAATTNGE